MSFHDFNPVKGISDELNAIKQQVAGKFGDYPFVLFPVRIETRFMEEDVILTPIYEDPFDIFEGVVVDLGFYSDFALLPTWSNAEFIQQVSFIVENLDLANEHVQKSLPADAARKRKVEVVHDQFRSKVAKVEKKLKDISTIDSNLGGQATELLGAIRNGKKSLKADFLKKPVTEKTAWSDASAVLDQVNAVKRTVKKINNKEVALPRKESKTRVYPYLDKKFSDIGTAYQSIQFASRNHLKATKTQFERIVQLKDEIQNDLALVPERLGSIQSDFKRDEYQLRFQQLQEKELNTMLVELEEEILPKMNYMNALKRVAAKDMIFDGRKMLRNFQLRNAQQITNYQWIKDHREGMYDQLRDFRADSRKIIEGNPEDIKQLKKIWTQVDAEIARFTTKIQTEFQPKTRTERAGVNRAITPLTDEYRNDLDGLLESAPEVIRGTVPKSATSAKRMIPLGNKDFTNSSKSYHLAQKHLKALNAQVGQINKASSPKAADINALHEQLIGFSQSYARLERDTTVLPNAFYQEIQSEIQTLEAGVQQMHQSVNALNISGVQYAVSSRGKPAQSLSLMKSTASHFYADVVDEQDFFYDETRPDIIFATHTSGTQDVLWVRVYPDDIMVDSHEDELTTDEIRAGQEFWFEHYLASGYHAMEKAAWNALCADFGSRRAAWVAKQMKPQFAQMGPFARIRDLIQRLQRNNEHMANGYKRFVTFPIEANNLPFNHLEKAVPEIRAAEVLIEYYRNRPVVPEFLYQEVTGYIIELKSLIDQGMSMLQHPYMGETGAGFVQNITASAQKILEVFNGMRPMKAAFVIQNEGIVFQFPNRTPKENSWSKASETYVLPDRFVVIAVKDGEIRHAQVGQPIPNNLKVGINPIDENGFQHDLNGNLNVPEYLQWMVDYSEAKKVGMGITLPLSQDEATEGFDQLYVLGVRNDSRHQGQNLLESLFKNHRYDDEG
ncbi:MAG: hypothetical protein AAF598_04080, partial [Bacteroidota bacterium]